MTYLASHFSKGTFHTTSRNWFISFVCLKEGLMTQALAPWEGSTVTLGNFYHCHYYISIWQFCHFPAGQFSLSLGPLTIFVLKPPFYWRNPTYVDLTAFPLPAWRTDALSRALYTIITATLFRTVTSWNRKKTKKQLNHDGQVTR